MPCNHSKDFLPHQGMGTVKDEFMELNTHEAAILALVLTRGIRDIFNARNINPHTGEALTRNEIRHRHDSMWDFRELRHDLMCGFDAMTVLDRLSKTVELDFLKR